MVRVDVESVVVSGPALSFIGAAIVCAGVKVRYWPAVGVGAAHIGFCLLLFALVVILGWGPSGAQCPFAFMGAGYGVLIIPLSGFVLMRLPRCSSEAECRHCGYLLYGLVEPRCPECGEPFDPRLLKKLSKRSTTREAPPRDERRSSKLG
jgi:hypothetical protein